MRKHVWGIILSQREIPDIVRNAFPDIQQPSPGVDGTYLLQLTTFDPITDAQVVLMKVEQLSAYGICSLSCSSQEVEVPSHLEMTTGEATISEEYLYTFTLRGHISVAEEHGEEIAYGWTKAALEDLTLHLPPKLQKQVKDFQISSVDLYLEENNNENEV